MITNNWTVHKLWSEVTFQPANPSTDLSVIKYDFKCNNWIFSMMHHHNHHLSLNCEGYWGNTDDFTTSFLHFFLLFIALWDLANSRPVHSLMLSFHVFLHLPCLLLHLTVPCKMVLARTDERETCPYHCSLHVFTIIRRSSCGPIACWILARTSSLVTRSFYEMRSIFR